MVHSQNVLKDFQQSTITNGKAVFTIDKNKLADGISVTIVFNSGKQPVCERLYFKKPVAKLNIQSQTDKAEYATRKPVSFSINATANSNVPAVTNMSLQYL
jgi:hypothetical protein